MPSFSFKKNYYTMLGKIKRKTAKERKLVSEVDLGGTQMLQLLQARDPQVTNCDY